jgi:hypothetical protein
MLPCPALHRLQSNATTFLPPSGPTSLSSLLGLSFNQIRADPALLALAQANGYSSVDALFPGINAFMTEVRPEWIS